MPIRKEGWMEKRSVSQPLMKNWRSRHVVLWDDRVCWHKDAGQDEKGEMALSMDTLVVRNGATLSVLSEGKTLVLRGTEAELDDWELSIGLAVAATKKKLGFSKAAVSSGKLALLDAIQAETSASREQEPLEPPPPPQSGCRRRCFCRSSARAWAASTRTR